MGFAKTENIPRLQALEDGARCGKVVYSFCNALRLTSLQPITTRVITLLISVHMGTHLNYKKQP